MMSIWMGEGEVRVSGLEIGKLGGRMGKRGYFMRGDVVKEVEGEGVDRV